MPKSLPVIDMSTPVCCAPVAAGPLSDDDALQIAMRLKALADPVRVKIMSHLFDSGNRSVVTWPRFWASPSRPSAITLVNSARQACWNQNGVA